MALQSLRLRRAFSSLSTLNRSFSIITPVPISPLVPLQTAHHPSPPFSFLQSSNFVTSRALLVEAGKREMKLYREGDEITEDTILFEGCDYNHWLITMEFPIPKPSPEEMVAVYEQTCAKGLNISIEEAKKRIYACSTSTFNGFQAVMTESESEKFNDIHGVVFVLPDSYIDPVNKEYGGDKYENGVITHRPPPVQYQQGRRGGDRNRERNRNYEPRYDQQGRPMQNQQGSPQYGQQGGAEYAQQSRPQYGQQRSSQDGGFYGTTQQQHHGPPGQGERSPVDNRGHAPRMNDGYSNRTSAVPPYQGNINQGQPGNQSYGNQVQPGNQGQPGQGYYNQAPQRHQSYVNEGQQGNVDNYNRGQQENRHPQHQRATEHGVLGANVPSQGQPWGDNRNHMANQPGSHAQADNAEYRQGHPSQAQSFIPMDQRSVRG